MHEEEEEEEEDDEEERRVKSFPDGIFMVVLLFSSLDSQCLSMPFLFTHVSLLAVSFSLTLFPCLCLCLYVSFYLFPCLCLCLCF